MGSVKEILESSEHESEHKRLVALNSTLKLKKEDLKNFDYEISLLIQQEKEMLKSRKVVNLTAR